MLEHSHFHGSLPLFMILSSSPCRVHCADRCWVHLCCIPVIWWTRDHEMVITSSRQRTFFRDRQFCHHDVIVVYVYVG